MNNLSKKQLLFIRQQKKHRITVQLSRAFLIVGFLLLWEFSSQVGYIDSFVFSSPSKVFLCFYEMLLEKTIFPHIGITLFETIVSFLLVTTISIFVSLILWFSKKLTEILEPIFIILNSLPKSALAPLLIVWLGATPTTIIVAGISVALFGSILNLSSSFQDVEDEKVKLIYTLGGSKFQVLTKIILPSSVPTIISNTKVNIGLCLVGVVIGEFLAAKRGLGYLIIYSSQVFKMDWLIMSICLLCLIAICLYGLITILEKRYQKESE